MTDIVDVFCEVSESGPLGPSSYRAGYRIQTKGSIVCTVVLPAAIAEAAILSNSVLAIAVTNDGHIRSNLSGTTDSKSTTEPIDKLIAQFLSAENLHLEEVTAADLRSLLERLERSIDLVQAVMKHAY